MNDKLKTKFYEFSQNNSGGFFDVDGNVCNRVIIEAMSETHAKYLFTPMIKNQSYSCNCCGDRWDIDYLKEINSKILKEYEVNTLEEYCQKIADRCGWTEPDAIIHYLDGTKKEIFISNEV